MVLAAFVLLGLVGTARGLGGDPECWESGLTPKICCDLARGAEGDPQCWDQEFTFDRCCGSAAPAPPRPPPVTRPGSASYNVAQHRISPSDVPGLPLLGGSSMPMAGIGMCCRPGANGEAARQAVLDYLLMGGRHLDDAWVYNNNIEVGEGIRQAVALGVPRAEIFLTTKIPPVHFGFEATTEWVERSLDMFGLDYLDLVLLHWASVPVDGRECKVPKQCRQETWLALQRAKRKGLIRHLGVSNFGERQISELLSLGGEAVEVNQIEFHPWVPDLHRQTAEWCHQRGIVVTAYGSMGSAGLASQLVAQEVLKQIGGVHGKTAGQVLLRWAVQQNVSVIPGTSNPSHMAENLKLFDFALSPQELAVLEIPEDQRHLHFDHWPDRLE